MIIILILFTGQHKHLVNHLQVMSIYYGLLLSSVFQFKGRLISFVYFISSDYCSYKVFFVSQVELVQFFKNYFSEIHIIFLKWEQFCSFRSFFWNHSGSHVGLVGKCLIFCFWVCRHYHNFCFGVHCLPSVQIDAFSKFLWVWLSRIANLILENWMVTLEKLFNFGNVYKKIIFHNLIIIIPV